MLSRPRLLRSWRPVVKSIEAKGSPAIKKGDIVPFGRPPSHKRVKRGHLLSEKVCKSRQMRFRDKTAYVWGLGYH